MFKSLLLLALLPYFAHAGLTSMLNSIPNPKHIFDITNDCLKARFASECAFLYDDEGCEGWQEPIAQGYRELSWRRRNDAESVVVRKGCTFTGYQHSNKDVSKRGRSITVDARGAAKDMYRDFNDAEELESRISSVDCKC